MSGEANQNCTFPPSCFHSPQLAALTFLSWPSGPRPWLRLLTTSPTELQIGWHTIPQILIQWHIAPTSHTPSILFSHIHSVHSLIHFYYISFPPALPEPTATRPSWQLCTVAATSPTLLEARAQAEGVRAHKAAASAAVRNKGGTLHHSNRGHSDSCLRHTHTDKRPEKQMVCAFMTSLVEAQESPLFKGGFLSAIP